MRALDRTIHLWRGIGLGGFRIPIMVGMLFLTGCEDAGADKDFKLWQELLEREEILHHLVWINPDVLELPPRELHYEVSIRIGISKAIMRERERARATIAGAYLAETGLGPLSLMSEFVPIRPKVDATASLSREIHAYCAAFSLRRSALCRWMEEYKTK